MKDYESSKICLQICFYGFMKIGQQREGLYHLIINVNNNNDDNNNFIFIIYCTCT